jgi:16S rRNA (uracil1498-N3)-methyltransferase
VAQAVPRLYCPTKLAAGASLALPAGAARHVQVLRMQPGGEVTLFNGEGGQWQAVIERMGRTDVHVRVSHFENIEREAPVAVHLAVGLTANERMDWLIEKATELGATSIQPLVTARSVLRISGERALKKREHWQAIAAAACEQCGRNRVPTVHEPKPFDEWISAAPVVQNRIVLSLSNEAASLSETRRGNASEWLCVSGPEGGLDPREEQMALDAGFAPVTLGPRVLRAETAPVALLGALAVS